MAKSDDAFDHRLRRVEKQADANSEKIVELYVQQAVQRGRAIAISGITALVIQIVGLVVAILALR